MGKKKKRGRIRGVVTALFVVVLIGLFGATLAFLYGKSQTEEVVHKTETAKLTDLVQKAVATGSIVPRREVQLKPRVSGIVESLLVKPGDVVEEGTLIAEIKIVPNMAALAQARGGVRSAEIAVSHAERELTRVQELEQLGVASKREMAELTLNHELSKAELASALDQLRVVREGAVKKSAKTSNTKVRATVAGTVLEVPVEVGTSVIESNTFNDGTTIGIVADMDDMIFLGRVDEADVDKVRRGMTVNIKIGAIDDHSFPGELEYISPKGKKVEGSLQFEIKAAFKTDQDVTIRAGYSANAEIVLEKKDQVLALPESLLQFDGDKPYVEVEVGPGKVERRDLKLGISDGIQIEVVSGVDKTTKIREPSPN